MCILIGASLIESDYYHLPEARPESYSGDLGLYTVGIYSGDLGPLKFYSGDLGPLQLSSIHMVIADSPVLEWSFP